MRFENGIPARLKIEFCPVALVFVEVLVTDVRRVADHRIPLLALPCLFQPTEEIRVDDPDICACGAQLLGAAFSFRGLFGINLDGIHLDARP